MVASSSPDLVLSRLSEQIAGTMGLNFPPERWADLQRGLAGAAREFGFSDPIKCAEWLTSTALTKAQQKILASHLTIGETYFFREPRTFDVFAHQILPELIRTRRAGDRRLRLWSAACCTGEEAYSLSILLSQVIPDLADWRVTILATDINPLFLKKAAAGIYGEWSFRDAPAGYKERYFRRTPDGRYAVLPDLKKRVTFAHLNLVEDGFPSLDTDTNAMDIVFCRNVLMYFALPQLRHVVGNLHRTLVNGGWLAVSPSEVSQGLFADFKAVNFPGVILYQKTDVQDRAPRGEAPPPFAPIWDSAAAPVTAPAWTFDVPPPVHPENEVDVPEEVAPVELIDLAEQYYREGRYADAEEVLLAARRSPNSPAEFSLLARALANQGRLADALTWCDRWLASDKLIAAAHYLRAVVLQELGQSDQSRQSLQNAVYLQPDLILAHFAMGNLARAGGTSADASRHFANALHLLQGRPSDEPLPESDGLTAGRLTEIITSLLSIESSS
jgi:chemotaxis protein methyltransferase CheR